ncbi:site-specific DNA-methyltransferase [Spirulina subsalsa FACHB-351]|uniref:site-specific DNA-methyltransferase (cytosine-N(4)-specific) n=1 Tax=Spirulina subsalsa FACHB-351 TaxID=234711 RepID=A0ABT3L621_9CYAN|nr:site-specific DNA-methyltransferase [Spirulina subsalsa]MCW6036887.1 site-specific DNA-methyltransferase [Spirulina subsalsa FACHB-351]
MNKFVQLELFNLNPESHGATQSQVIDQRSGTFTDNMKLPIHRWFRYSAGFSAAWVEQMITDFKPQMILDPFAGSGTVSIVADQLGVKSFGVEAHPFVCKLARAKLAWTVHPSHFLKAATELKQLALTLKLKPSNDLPNLLKKCYQEDNLADLLNIKQAYFNLAPSYSEKIQILLFLAISAILRPSSHVGTAQWQYILPNKRKAKTCNPFEALEKQIAFMAEDIKYLQSVATSSQAIFLQEDARTLKNIPYHSIDLVITSPPYANNYDYADATRLEMTFWGEVNSWGDLHQAVRQFLIRSSSQHTAKDRLLLESLVQESILEPIREELIPICQELAIIRETKAGKKAYHTMVAAYFNDLGLVFQALRRVTKSNSKLCFVVGDSAPYGLYVPVQKWLGELAIAAGFTYWSFEPIRQRNTKWKNRKHNVPLQEGRLWING